MPRDTLVNAVVKMGSIDEVFDIDLCVVCKQEKNSGYKKLIVTVVNFESFCCFWRVTNVNERLSRSLVEQKSVGKTS